jgi:hypothetical protein
MQMNKQFKTSQSNPFSFARLTTAQLATILRVKPQTIRASLCRSGNYLGIRPVVKLPNGRLLWPSESLEMLVSGEVL